MSFPTFGIPFCQLKRPSPFHSPHIDSRCLRIFIVLLVTFYSAKGHIKTWFPMLNATQQKGLGASEESGPIRTLEVRWWSCELVAD